MTILGLTVHQNVAAGLRGPSRRVYRKCIPKCY